MLKIIRYWKLRDEHYPLSQQHEARFDLSDHIKIKLFDPAGDSDQINIKFHMLHYITAT